MIKARAWHTLTHNYETITYFYNREKNDINGNPRYKVFILDPDGVVYEMIFKCYEEDIESRIITLLEMSEK